MQNFDVEDLFQRGLNALNTRVTEFQYLIAIGEDNMVVLLILECSLIVGCILTKLMLTHQVAINEKLNGVVQGSP